MRLLRLLSCALLVFSLLISCSENQEKVDETNEFKVDYEKFTLDNGLQVIFHIDRSDPVVSVVLTSHVGSGREIENRTGFAHLFEHLLFLESENLGKGGLDKMSARIGGSGANGFTNRDITSYHQTVPKDALEKMIWAEADKLGYFINTVSEPVLAKEKQVVKNEKRQRVDNIPYGHTYYVIDKNLYPESHPYNWQVIGSLEDLQNATLQDVKDFYNRWYVPNNVILTIAGDFDVAQAKEWVNKYFGEIRRGDDIPKMEKQLISLPETKKLYYEDNFARAPQLTITWPGVYGLHKDSYALDVLINYLSQGKKAPLYKVLVEDKKLTDRVDSYQYSSEVAGQLMVQVTAFPNTGLEEVFSGIEEGFSKFETEGVSQGDLDRIKAGQEFNYFDNLSSVLWKGFMLANYEIYAGDPAYINEDVKNIQAVSIEDVVRVYNTYIKNKPYIVTSFVPKNQKELALSNSMLAEVVEEKVDDGTEEAFDASIAAAYEKTPSSFDRSIEPPYGESPDVKVPNILKDELPSGLKVFSIQNTEVPLVRFELQIDGGMLLENPEKIGVSNLLAELMDKGTASKTPEEFENAMESLGASIRISASKESIVIAGNTMSKNYGKTMDLVSELLLQPRWDLKEFELIRQSVLSQIERQKAEPNSIADSEYDKLIYGEDNILSHNILGTEASVNNITIDDLKSYYNSNITSSLAKFRVAGSVSKEEIIQSLSLLNKDWISKEVLFPEWTNPVSPEKSVVYFYDVPDAKQSVFRFGYPSLKATDNDYYLTKLLNYRLGGGGFASQLTQQLREGKGYTYGIRSNYSGSARTGSFKISSNVRSNVTYESASLVKEIIQKYGENFGENDLELTQSFIIKSNARAFETLDDKLDILRNISNYSYADDYPKQRENIVKNLTVDQVKSLAENYLTADKMIYLVVGDAKTQMDKLQGLGYGKPILLNKE